MNKIILADSQAISELAQPKCWLWTKTCASLLSARPDRMHHAITTFPGAIVLLPPRCGRIWTG